MAASSASDLQASAAGAAAVRVPVAASTLRSSGATKTSAVGKYAICLIMVTFLHAHSYQVVNSLVF